MSRIDWDHVPLGVLPDGELARRLGVSRQWVAKHRVARGIPAAGGGSAVPRSLTKMERDDMVALEAAIVQIFDAVFLTTALATTVCRTPGWQVEARRALHERARATAFRIRAPGRRRHTEWLSPERARVWLLEAGWADAAAAYLDSLRARAGDKYAA